MSRDKGTRGKIMERNLDGLKKKRPTLEEIPISNALNRGIFTVTMSIGQWDEFLQTAYNNGATLLELDGSERPVKAFRKRMSA